MGLAPYGEQRYAATIRDHLIDIREDGSFRLNMEQFEYAHGLRMTGRPFERLFDGSRRKPESPLTQREMDLARSIQDVTEEVILRMSRHVHGQTREDNLCLAGGVALNCVANGRLQREGPYEKIWIQPAAGDAGGALGAALVAWYDYFGHERVVREPDSMKSGHLGPEYDDAGVAAFLNTNGIPHVRLEGEDRTERVASLLADGMVVGWFQGRMEFGPRALGCRSILADPRGRDVQRRVNLKIKFRESFRPFAPSVTSEDAPAFFDLNVESPYMLLVSEVRDALIEGHGLERLSKIDSRVPAVTHVDGSARIQTVDAHRNPLFHQLLKTFEQKTGCPVLVNTSFNVRGEPIVCTPSDAYQCFSKTHMDALVMGSYLVTKEMLGETESDIYSLEEIASQYGLD
jgi:carbamoyltransferase